MKKLLLLNGGYNEIPLVNAAHDLGFYVITSGNDMAGAGHLLADEFHPVDYSDKSAVLRLATELRIDAICSASNDFAALSASFVADSLGLPGHDSFDVSRVFHEKDEFRHVASRLGLNVPASADFCSVDDANDFAKTADYPLMVKPVDLSGGKGVSLAKSYDEAQLAIEHAFMMSKVKRVILEEYIEGSQHGFICFVSKGRVVFDTSTNDYVCPINPWLIGSSFGHYADGYSEVRDRIIADVESLVSCCNAADGFLTIQYAMKDGEPYYLETMRRCLGNMHFVALSEETGVDWAKWFIASQSGLSCESYYESARLGDKCSGFVIAFASQTGVIRSVAISDAFAPYIKQVYWLKHEGDYVSNPKTDKVGVLLFSCDEKDRRELIESRNELIRVICE